jgi:hypothetical protein
MMIRGYNDRVLVELDQTGIQDGCSLLIEFDGLFYEVDELGTRLLRDEFFLLRLPSCVHGPRLLPR